MSYSFYCMTMPGLETVAFNEIRTRVPGAELTKFSRGIALFGTTQLPDSLLDLRTVEDVFCTLVHTHGLGPRQDALKVLHSATLHAAVEDALRVWRHLRGAANAKTWRVVSQMTGSHDFRRVDAGRAVSDALKRVLSRKMRFVEDDADLEFWLWLSGSEALIGLRLSDASMRHRTYKQEHLPASLRPTVAAAMGWMSQPGADDVVLDPLCGAGTILIERALLAPYDTLVGGDMRREAVAIARRNARSAVIDARWRVWDARALRMDAASVTRVITNLPFGKQIGSHATNEELYASLAKEFRRVLAPNGVLVALTSEDRLWETCLRTQGWCVKKKLVLVVLGQPASIFVAEYT